jgi:trans-aconitate methyltransferase
VDRLLERGAQCATVLDVSAAALARAKARLGDAHTRVTWIEADVTSDWHVDPVDVWHDRAAFHFLTEPTERSQYVERVRHAVKPGGTVIMATFAPDGPDTCSGLQVRRYDVAALSAQLGAGFSIVEALPEQHRTPRGAMQSFCYAVFRRGGS